MNRTRLAAAAGVVALTLGATAAVAADTTDTQTVTITVTAAPRSITVGTPANAFSVAAGAAASDSTTSSLAYNAGPDEAKITVNIDAAGNGLTDTALFLIVLASGMEESEGTATFGVTLDKDTLTTSFDLVREITAGEIVTGKTVTYTLGGTAPSTDGSHNVDLKFTITDQPVM